MKVAAPSGGHLERIRATVGSIYVMALLGGCTAGVIGGDTGSGRGISTAPRQCPPAENGTSEQRRAAYRECLREPQQNPIRCEHHAIVIAESSARLDPALDCKKSN